MKSGVVTALQDKWVKYAIKTKYKQLTKELKERNQ
jgi:hypothetical protein